MEELKIISIDGSQISVECIYYFSNNNYYLIYTTKQIDENGYAILYITKIAREIINVSVDEKRTGLVGLEITDDTEWKNVQTDISNVIEDKKKNTNSVTYLPASSLINLKVKGFRIFRLRPDILQDAFNIFVTDTTSDLQNKENMEFMDYKTKYIDSIDRIKELEDEVNSYKQQIAKIRKILEK